MVDYAKLAATTLRLITKNGKTVTFNKFSKAAVDSGKPWRGTAPAVVETQQEKVVEVGSSSGNQASSYGGLFSKKDIPDEVTDLWLVARTPSNPALEDYDQLVEADSTQHKIEMIIRLKPADIVLLYVVGTSR